MVDTTDDDSGAASDEPYFVRRISWSLSNSMYSSVHDLWNADFFPIAKILEASASIACFSRDSESPLIARLAI